MRPRGRDRRRRLCRVAVWLYLRQRSARSEAVSVRAAKLMIAPTASGIGVTGRF
jgi:hypothetical protein